MGIQYRTYQSKVAAATPHPTAQSSQPIAQPMDTSVLTDPFQASVNNGVTGQQPRDNVSQLTRLLIYASMAISAAIFVVLWFITPSWPVTAWLNAGLFVLGAAMLALLRAGREHAAGVIVLIAFTAAIAVDSLNPNRPFGLSAPLAPLSIVFAALLYGRRALHLALAFNCLWLLVVTLVKPLLFTLPERAMRMQLIDASAYCVYFVCTAVVTLLTTRRVEKARQHADSQAAEIARRARELEHEVRLRQKSERALQERAREVAWLLEISNSLTTSQDLEPLLAAALRQLADLAPHDVAVIAALSKDNPAAARVLSVNGDESASVGAELTFTDADDALHGHIATQKPLILTDMRSVNAQTQAMRAWLQRNLCGARAAFESVMLVPLIARGETRGVMLLAANRPGAYTTELGEFVLAFANQCALAIQTSDEQRGRIEIARINERTKLAHDLHDSVSQSLYGIVLGSHTALGALNTLMQNNDFKNAQAESQAAKLADSLNYVVKQADAGLVEMRALIYELRPEHLLETTLCDAVGRQIAALCTRHMITCEAHTRGHEAPMSITVKEAAYRIALQAAANSIQHSQCRVIRMDCTHEHTGSTLIISDDGRGFDPAQPFEGRFGLKTMRERAAQTGIQLDIDSAPGRGVTVTLRVPADKDR